jgi:hypothetical protein
MILFAAFDIILLMKIQERKAQIARVAYFTIPAVCGTVGWMGGLEIAKKVTHHSLYYHSIIIHNPDKMERSTGYLYIKETGNSENDDCIKCYIVT